MAKKKPTDLDAASRADVDVNADVARFLTEQEIESLESFHVGVPGAPRPPKVSLMGCMVWEYGVQKIGKTTFANQFPGPWFWATEKGQDFVHTREPTVIGNWEQLLELCGWIDTEKPVKFGDGVPINTLVVDKVDDLHLMCQDYVCKRAGVDHPGDEDHGKLWGQVSGEFSRVMGKIRRWPFGMVAISHERTKKFKARGRDWDRYEPNIGAAGYRWCSSAADLILHAFMQDVAMKDENGVVTGQFEERRLLRCHPSANAVAGGRMAHLLPEIVPLSYPELMRALTRGIEASRKG